MATNGVWQLKTLTIRYCTHSGSSRYIRDLLKDQKLIHFAKENPQLVVKSEIKSGRHPILIGTYCEEKVCDVKNREISFVLEKMQKMRDSSGRKMTKMSKPVITKKPSIQGVWQGDIKFPEMPIQHFY